MSATCTTDPGHAPLIRECNNTLVTGTGHHALLWLAVHKRVTRVEQLLPDDRLRIGHFLTCMGSRQHDTFRESFQVCQPLGLFQLLFVVLTLDLQVLAHL